MPDPEYMLRINVKYAGETYQQTFLAKPDHIVLIGRSTNQHQELQSQTLENVVYCLGKELGHKYWDTTYHILSFPNLPIAVSNIHELDPSEAPEDNEYLHNLIAELMVGLTSNSYIFGNHLESKYTWWLEGDPLDFFDESTTVHEENHYTIHGNNGGDQSIEVSIERSNYQKSFTVDEFGLSVSEFEELYGKVTYISVPSNDKKKLTNGRIKITTEWHEISYSQVLASKIDFDFLYLLFKQATTNAKENGELIGRLGREKEGLDHLADPSQQ